LRQTGKNGAMTDLTGLELNLYERAGFAVRRGAFDPVATGRGIPTEILRLCRDILGREVVEESPVQCAGAVWGRAFGAGVAAPHAELARLQDSVWAVAAFTNNTPLCVLPGSHLQPLDEDLLERLSRNPADELPGQVCLKMDPGDGAIISPTMLAMALPPVTLEGMGCWIVRRMRPAF
jgi:hypothetical protein